VIELAAPAVLRQLGASGVTLLTGERPPAVWLRGFRRAIHPARVRVVVDPVLGYTEERLAPGKVRAALDRGLLGPGVVWAHNLALGRNLALARALATACAARGLPLVAHHHDWWCDRRWARWPVIRRTGFPSQRAVAAAIFPTAGRVAHVAINLSDAAILQQHLGAQAHWLPNLIDRPVPRRRRPPPGAPIWLLPCRVLRRKNLAEALLLTRWLRPEATLVVTGGADETDEQPYAATLAAAARAHGWPLQLGALADQQARGTIADFFARAEVMVCTSVQEGFGLPQLEAAAAGCPAILRRVPLVAADLHRFGFRFPQLYDDLRIAPALFDWLAEVRRQTRAFAAWRALLPRSVRALAGPPALLTMQDRPQPIAFSRLTLAAQLEVLRQPPDASWSRCAPLNPFLLPWRERAASGTLAPTRWPRAAEAHLSSANYARRFARIVAAGAAPPPEAVCGLAAQGDFIRARLASTECFPLLWSPR